MSDLTVDLAELAHSRDELAALIEEFDNAANIAESEDVGSSDVAGALHEFSTNWNVHKKELVKEMTAVHSMVEKSHDGYLDTDSELAKDIANALQRRSK